MFEFYFLFLGAAAFPAAIAFSTLAAFASGDSGAFGGALGLVIPIANLI
jgi:hypothetical protein